MYTNNRWNRHVRVGTTACRLLVQNQLCCYYWLLLRLFELEVGFGRGCPIPRHTSQAHKQTQKIGLSPVILWPKQVTSNFNNAIFYGTENRVVTKLKSMVISKRFSEGRLLQFYGTDYPRSEPSRLFFSFRGPSTLGI